MANNKVRRNSFNQIVSYTKLDTDSSEFEPVYLPAQKVSYSETSFNKFINTDVSELLIPIEDSNLSVIMLNTITINNTTSDTTLKNDFKWSGEIVRIGYTYELSNVVFYYIENGMYHKLPNQLTINLVAEKLSKPLFFKIDEEYDYSDDLNDQYRFLDNGQNQYIIYDGIGNSPTKMYERKTIGYLDSFEKGLPVSLTDIVSDENMVMLLNFELVKNTSLLDSQPPHHMEFGSDTSTNVRFKRRYDVSSRQMILKPGDDLNYKFTKQANGFDVLNQSYNYTLELYYNDGQIVNLELNNELSGGSIGTVVNDTISGEYITSELDLVKITLNSQ
jgi:hypothetical protein